MAVKMTLRSFQGETVWKSRLFKAVLQSVCAIKWLNFQSRYTSESARAHRARSWFEEKKKKGGAFFLF